MSASLAFVWRQMFANANQDMVVQHVISAVHPWHGAGIVPKSVIVKVVPHVIPTMASASVGRVSLGHDAKKSVPKGSTVRDAVKCAGVKMKEIVIIYPENVSVNQDGQDHCKFPLFHYFIFLHLWISNHCCPIDFSISYTIIYQESLMESFVKCPWNYNRSFCHRAKYKCLHDVDWDWHNPNRI